MPRWPASLPYDQPMPRPKLRTVLAAGLVALALLAMADRPGRGGTAGDRADFTLLPAKTSPTPPSLSVSCPDDASGDWVHYDVRFGYRVESPDPVARVAIDYGDGHTYESTTTDGVFAHRYTSSGTFTVSATLTTNDGLASSASCSWRLSMPGQ